MLYISQLNSPTGHCTFANNLPKLSKLAQVGSQPNRLRSYFD
jgi:hypothetical protein